MQNKYSKTITACFTGYIVQAIVNVFVPLLFINFQTAFNIPIEKITLLITINFFIQLITDTAAAWIVDKIGYRICTVSAHISAAAGLLLLSFLPQHLEDPYMGLIISVVLYAVGGGLLEVVISPMVEACPSEHKDKTMSMLHSFYCWGAVGTILISSLFFLIFGIDNWKWLAVIWAIIPAVNAYNFLICPIEPLVDNGSGMGIKNLFSQPFFWVAICLMICSGASELSMAQWASAYAESALGLSKTLGDLAGPCMFAVTMGISRMIFGKYGEQLNLMNFMSGSGILCVICYLLAALSSSPVIGLLGCIACGFSVGIMWPGTISISSKTFPTGGTAMFSLLAMAGDLGGSIGPGIVGHITQNAENNIQIGMGFGLIFPVILLFMLFLLYRKNQHS